ncbi:MAG TPA: DUF475 domain-containing protein [Actinocrinis sp.]|nr:DUF475 domain-containing protein [Actinocrinis sp.]
MANRSSGLRLFGVAHTIAVACLVAAYLLNGFQGLTVALLLGILEIAVSFDNAIVNATVLARMGAFWQQLFLTVGVLIAAVGMRLLAPLAVVSIGAHMDPVSAVRLAYSNPDQYHHLLLAAQPGIAAFGGAFLLMIFLQFATEEHETEWIAVIERPLRRISEFVPSLGPVVIIAVAVAAASSVRSPMRLSVMIGASIGLGTYLLINGLSEKIADQADADGSSKPRATVTGRGAFFLFCYLELLDATFSFDSVMGAFSVTLDIAMITLGLAIGAAYIRCLTVFVVRRGTLDEYRYLEHGAYYAIGALATLLFVEVWHDVPDVLTASIGALIIVAAVVASVMARHRHDRQEDLERTDAAVTPIHKGSSVAALQSDLPGQGPSRNESLSA